MLENLPSLLSVEVQLGGTTYFSRLPFLGNYQYFCLKIYFEICRFLFLANLMCFREENEILSPVLIQ